MKSLQEGILDQVLCRIIIAGQTVKITPERFAVRLDDAGERVSVAASNQGYYLSFLKQVIAP